MANAAQEINRLFQEYLGRAPSAPELAYWVEQYNATVRFYPDNPEMIYGGLSWQITNNRAGHDAEIAKRAGAATPAPPATPTTPTQPATPAQPATPTAPAVGSFLSSLPWWAWLGIAGGAYVLLSGDDGKRRRRY